MLTREDLRSGNRGETICERGATRPLQQHLHDVRIRVRQVIRTDDNRCGLQFRKMLHSRHMGLAVQEPIGEQMVNPLCEGIAWIVAPPDVRGQPLLEGKERIWTGAINLLFKRGANVLQCQEVLDCQEIEDRREELITHRHLMAV